MYMIIKFYRKNVYGNDRIYILDEAIASILRMLTGRKSYDVQDIKLLQKLGLTTEEVIAPR